MVAVTESQCLMLAHCNECGTAYAPAVRCPSCGDTDSHEQGQPVTPCDRCEREGHMPKISRHVGPTIAGRQRPVVDVTPGIDAGIAFAGRPTQNAPKSDWEDYVTALGIEVEPGASKRDLIDAVIAHETDNEEV